MDKMITTPPAHRIIEAMGKEVKSSYHYPGIGKDLYDLVLELKPVSCIEFGALHGYSAACISLALEEIGFGKLYSYDLWEDYEYTGSRMDIAQETVNKFGAPKHVQFGKADVFEWFKNPTTFDFMHIDVSNDGDTILQAYNACRPQIERGSVITFEGGSLQRDIEPWMVKYNRKRMNDIREQVGYELVNEKWPSMGIINKK